MATATGKLTAIAIKSAEVGKLFDGGGLFLDVRDNGSRYWRIKYHHAGKVRAAYNRVQYLAERRKMMQAWADYLDVLRADTGKVVAFERKLTSKHRLDT